MREAIDVSQARSVYIMRDQRARNVLRSDRNRIKSFFEMVMPQSDAVVPCFSNRMHQLFTHKRDEV